MSKDKRIDAYMRLVEWAKKRYAKNSEVILYHRGGIPSKYTMIENAAWDKYINKV